MIASGGSLYVVEPNHGELDRVSTSGSISRVADISATQGHIVPTAIAQRGAFYIGNLNTFPIVPGSSKILQVTPGGQVHTVGDRAHDRRSGSRSTAARACMFSRTR